MPSEFLRLKSQMPMLGIGIGLRNEICRDILQNANEIDFLEFVPENYSRNIVSTRWLSQYAEHFALIPHSVSLSIGSVDPIDFSILSMEREFARLFDAPWWSDHLCFSGVGGESGHDLFPLIWTAETVKHVAQRVKRVQDYVEKPFALENIPYYTRAPKGDFDEAEFITRVLEEADCGLLLDLNNLHVNSLNHNFDPFEFLDRIPLERVVQIHMAGHTKFGKRIVDTHGASLSNTVYELFEYTLKKHPQINSVMIERDQMFPTFNVLLAELQKLRAIWNRHQTPIPKKEKNSLETAGSNTKSSNTETSITEIQLPPKLVGEMANLKTALQKVSADSAVSSDVKTSDVAASEDLAVSGLSEYQKSWFSHWKHTKGKAPDAVDAKNFRPKFSGSFVGSESMDLQALSIYAWLRDSNLDAIMQGIFPATHRLLVSKWPEILERYFYDFNPPFYALTDCGDHFPEFLSKHYLQFMKTHPYLRELADFELTAWRAGRTHEVTDLSDEVYLGSTDQIKNCRPVINPEVAVREFTYPVHLLADMKVTLDAAAVERKHYIAFLPHQFSSTEVNLSETAAKLIESARPGALSYSQLIAAVLSPEQRQSPNEIAGLIELFQRLHESRIFISCERFRNVPVKTGWEIYYESVKDEAPHSTVVRAIMLFKESGKESGQAIDLGCGSGRDTKFLLESTWNVFAVDSSAESINRLETSFEEIKLGSLTACLADMTEANLPPADLVNASLSLPFCEPVNFSKLWNNICMCIRPQGRFSGHFFGRNDDWATNSKMSFHNRQEVEDLFSDFVLEYIEEVEGPMPLAGGGVKHGHWFEIVARKKEKA